MSSSKSSIKILEKIAEKSSHRLLVISFFPLHFSIWSSQDPFISKALFLVHIGIFLFWQPFISHKTQIQTRPTIILIFAILGIILLAGGLAQLIWIVLLVGILSSYRLGSLQDKLIFLLIISFLLIELFGGLIPISIKREADLLSDTDYISYLALTLNVLTLLLPTKVESFRNYSSDLLYSLIAISVVVLLAMATLLWMYYGGYSYFISLIYSLMTMAGVLIIFNLIFRPSSEIGLFAQFRDRYSLNLGTPFESFLIETAEISENTEDPDEYLTSAFALLNNLDWVNGLEWQTGTGSAEVNQLNGHRNEFNFDDLEVALYSNQALGPSMKIHAGLLVKIIEIFYTAKKREASLSRSAHMEAIYETGARLTHDIKNLMQSLTLMLSAANAKPMAEEDSKLFFSNLEIITNRLQQTLVKLRNPETFTEHSVSIFSWWNEIKRRESNQDYIHFSEELAEGIEIPEELFDSVLENLLDNAKKKKKREPDLEVKVNLLSGLDELVLSVSDNGEPVPEHISRGLMSGPVKSRSGFGIGLYQAAKQALAHGFTLELSSNETGDVSFSLVRK